MAYTAEISRGNPACFVFMIDQSGSMADSFGGGAAIRKADFVADVVNRTLKDLISRCTSTEAVLNRFHVGVIGYGGTVQSAFSGVLAGRDLVPIGEVADNPARVETRTKKVPDGAGGLVETQVSFPIWVDPRSNAQTPMCEAFRKVKGILEQWVGEHQSSFPPIVLHVTDGESTDGDPSGVGAEIGRIATQDGAVLVFNCHVSNLASAKVEYPASDASLPSDLARTLYRISSEFPAGFRSAAAETGIGVSEGCRGFVFNGDAASVVQLLDIGTRPANR